MPAQIPIGSAAPTAFAVKIAPSLTVPDLTTVTAVSFKVRRPDLTVMTLAGTIPATVPPGVDGTIAGSANPSPSSLVAVHVFDASEFTQTGVHMVTALLTVPGGTQPVRAYARPLILTDDFGQ